jgi:hypothetical protein
MPADNFDAVIASREWHARQDLGLLSGNHPNEFSEVKFIRRLVAEQSRSPTGRCPLCGGMCGSRERDFGQRDAKGELAQINANKNAKVNT